MAERLVWATIGLPLAFPTLAACLSRPFTIGPSMLTLMIGRYVLEHNTE